MEDQFIVAEVSKTWEDPNNKTDLVSKQFEQVINTNFKRGYTLQQWNLHTFHNHYGYYTETIIAIFEKVARTKA